jgi:hypothetical protein
MPRAFQPPINGGLAARKKESSKNGCEMLGTTNFVQNESFKNMKGRIGTSTKAANSQPTHSSDK